MEEEHTCRSGSTANPLQSTGMRDSLLLNFILHFAFCGFWCWSGSPFSKGLILEIVLTLLPCRKLCNRWLDSLILVFPREGLWMNSPWLSIFGHANFCTKSLYHGLWILIPRERRQLRTLWLWNWRRVWWFHSMQEVHDRKHYFLCFFLYWQVCNLTGWKRSMKSDYVAQILEAPDRSLAPNIAPCCLFFLNWLSFSSHTCFYRWQFVSLQMFQLHGSFIMQMGSSLGASVVPPLLIPHSSALHC